MPSTIRIETNQRAAFLGRTGSGKTTLAKFFLSPIRRLIVLDPKGMLTTPDWRLEDDNESARRRLLNKGYARIRVPAPFDGDWADILSFAWAIGNVVVYIDEVYGVVNPGSRPPAELVALYTRGRERGIGVWAASQRPVWVPLFMLSEADWLFVFRLQLDEDRRRVSEIMGPIVRNPIKDQYGFWVYNQLWEQPIYSSGLRLSAVKKVTA